VKKLLNVILLSTTVLSSGARAAGSPDEFDLPGHSSLRVQNTEIPGDASLAARGGFNIMNQSVTLGDDVEGFVEILQTPRNKRDDIALAALASDAAYNDGGAHLKRTALREGYEVTEFSASIDGEQVPAGLVLYKDGKVVVAYHGTETNQDIRTDLAAFIKVKASDVGLTGYVHSGFSERYLQSRDAVKDIIASTLARHKKSAEDVEFGLTGHSLGGALATLAAADFKTSLAQNSRLQLITISSPRVLNAEAANHLEQLIGTDKMLRLWRPYDPVAAGLLGVVGYKHTGTSIALGSKLNPHTLTTTVDEATGSKAATFTKGHVGIRGTLENGLNAVKRTVKSVFSKVASFFSRA
jgi:hypothetical protein